MKPALLHDLIYLLRDYRDKKITKDDFYLYYTKWIKNGLLTEEELTSLIPVFYEFYSDLSGVFRTLPNYKKEAKEEDLEEFPLLDYIEQFDVNATMPKKQIAELSGLSEAWIHKRKDNFEHSRIGVNIVSYLKWLKENNFNAYQEFKRNYK